MPNHEYLTSQKLDELESIFKEHFLDIFIDAADAICEAIKVDSYFGESTLSMGFWENYINRFKEVKFSDSDIAECINLKSNDLVLHIAQCSVRCHRVNSDSGTPNAANAAKRAALKIAKIHEDWPYLAGLEAEVLQREGNIIFGFFLDREEGLQSVIIGELEAPSKDSSIGQVKCTPLREIYRKQAPKFDDLPDFPDFPVENIDTIVAEETLTTYEEEKEEKIIEKHNE